MAKPFDICIRGSGIVGHTLALLLARSQLRVAIVHVPSAADQGHTDVRAYALNAASRSLLQSLRCWPDTADITPVLSMQVHGDRDGAVNFDAAAQNVPALAWIADVPALEARLREAVKYQPGIEMVEEQPHAPLTAICEGRASSTRDLMGVEFDRTPYGQSALATRVLATESHHQAARQWFSESGIAALLPLGGPDGREMAVVWSVSPSEAAELQALGGDDFARRLETATQQLENTLQLHGERHVWPLQLAQAQRWSGAIAQYAISESGRAWVLVGDAAHTVHPLSGQGLNLGLGDAQALAEALAQRSSWKSLGDLRTLRRYERDRKAALMPVRLSTDVLARLFVAQIPAIQSLRNWGMRGFDRSGPMKQWAARQAMNTSQDLTH